MEEETPPKTSDTASPPAGRVEGGFVPSPSDERLPPQDLLERRKLASEIREIKTRNRLSKRTFFHNEIRTWVTLIGGTLTGLATVFGLLLPYLNQRSQELEFKATNEIITLINQLSDPSTPKKVTAAMMLTLYGTDAVPLLISQLDVPCVVGPKLFPEQQIIQRSLEEILRKNSKAGDQIVDQLVHQGRIVFDRELQNFQCFTPMENFVVTLKKFEYIKKDTVQLVLNNFKKQLLDSTLREPPKKLRDDLVKEIEKK